MPLCEENCELINYDKNIEKVECSCDIKIKLPLIDDIHFNKEKLLQSFIDINNFGNFKIIKCYKNVFDKNTIKINLGFFIMSFMISLFLICFIIFYIKSKNSLNKEINDIVKEIKNKKYKKRLKNKKKKIKRKKKKSNNILKNTNNINVIELNNINTQNSKKKIKSKSNIDVLEKNKSKKKGDKIILEYKDYELNILNYKKALKFDKRTYFQYYISLLKINHLFIFSFFPNKDYNSRIIKIFLFFFFFIIHFTINAIFFNDNTIHKIYIDQGNYNFIYQIPQIIYSSLISGIITALIKFLSLSQDNIIQLKHTKKKAINKKHQKLLDTLKIKFILFFILSFLLLLFFWYYISCFCGVYINTQIHLIKDTIISFTMSLLYPFGICLIPGIFRITALSLKKRYLYKLSLLLQKI